MKRPSSLDNFRLYNGQLLSLEDYEQASGKIVQRQDLSDEEYQFLMGTEGVYDTDFYDE